MASKCPACSTPHCPEHTSISSGGSTFSCPANLIQLDVLARASASGSLGCQVRFGIAPAKHTACSPVPQPISSMAPCAGRTRFRTARMGAEFRATEGENMRLSAVALRFSNATDERSSFFVGIGLTSPLSTVVFGRRRGQLFGIQMIAMAARPLPQAVNDRLRRRPSGRAGADRVDVQGPLFRHPGASHLL